MTRLEIPTEFKRSAPRDLNRTEESARFLLQHVCGVLGLSDLGQIDLLDVGCGTKFSEALLNEGLPIKSYVGVDVYRDMIEFLQRSVNDERFEYHHTNVRNELYNPDAPPMTESTDLGVGDRTFDLIWLFSVFTHLNPQDFRTMLQLLRRYIRPTGHLFFTVYIHETTPGGYGYIDSLARLMEESPELPKEVVGRLQAGRRGVEPFMDLDPAHPLRAALYSRPYAYELIEGTGWQPVKLLEPNEFAQHQFLCTPVP